MACHCSYDPVTRASPTLLVSIYDRRITPSARPAGGAPSSIVIVSLVRPQLSITRVGHLQPRRERLQFTALIQRIGNGKSATTVHISVGLASNFADVYRLIAFARGFLDQTSAAIGNAAQACTKLTPDAG